MVVYCVCGVGVCIVCFVALLVSGLVVRVIRAWVLRGGGCLWVVVIDFVVFCGLWFFWFGFDLSCGLVTLFFPVVCTWGVPLWCGLWLGCMIVVCCLVLNVAGFR